MSPAGNESIVAIFARLFDPENVEYTPDVANALLGVAFSEADRNRMHELAVKNRTTGLTPDEDAELERFILAGDLLSVIQLKASLAKAVQTSP